MPKKTSASPVDAGEALSPLTTKIRNLRDELLTGLIERDVAIRLALLATLAGEHLLLIGPPGTAKSLLARRLRLAFSEATYFERLLTRFTVPEELFGPLSIKGLEEDRYERLTSSYLPTASVAFLDEIFKANSAILNALLTLLNEREFDNGTQRMKTPLIALVGASNELPEGQELDALFDRFLLRLHVGPVTQEAFPSLLGLRGAQEPEITAGMKLSREELLEVQRESTKVTVPEDVIAMLCELRDWCTAEEIPVSDRRWRSIVKMLQVSALTNGREHVSIWDCWLLQHCLWSNPEEREKLYTWYADRVGISKSMNPSQLTRIVVAWEGRLKSDQESRSQMKDENGAMLFKFPNGELSASTKGRVYGMRDGKPLYLAPDGAYYNSEHLTERTNNGQGFTLRELNNMQVRTSYNHRSFQHWSDRDAYLSNKSNRLIVELDLNPALEPTRYSSLYVDGRHSQIGTHIIQIEEYQTLLKAHVASMEQEIRSHLWVTDDFEEPASQTLKKTTQEVELLLSRLQKVQSGFGHLPREKDELPGKPKQRKGKK